MARGAVAAINRSRRTHPIASPPAVNSPRYGSGRALTEHARRSLDQLDAWLSATLEMLAGKSARSRAILCVEPVGSAHAPLRRRASGDRHPPVERALRGVAIGRRNYLFAGADSGCERAAAIYSRIGTAGQGMASIPKHICVTCWHASRITRLTGSMSSRRGLSPISSPSHKRQRYTRRLR